MKSRNNRKIIMYGLMVALLVTSVAYAALQTVLSINGTVTKKGGSWNIYFDNVSTPSLTGKATMAQPSLDSSTSLSFSVNLKQPLDKAVFTVDVVNEGTFDASLSSILLEGKAAAEEADVTYEITYADGTPVKQYDSLKVDQIRTLKIVVMYNDVDQVSNEKKTLDFGLTLIYIQGTENNAPSGNGSMGVLDSSLASYPDLLNDSLTPVIYDETASLGKGAWVIADTSKQWYNYSEQQWANAVILNSGVSTTPGTALNLETDVKAMYVWIPRYEYKIEGTYGTHTDGTPGTAALPGAIDVKFINSSQVSADTGYILHPAFTWDNDDNGSISADEQLSGIWVGKFETTGTEGTPTILPEVKAWNNMDSVSIQFAQAQIFATYLSRSANTDAHMMKNSEWGAVAYLSQSKYGKYGNTMYTGAYKEVFKNDSNLVFTGKSCGSPNSASYSWGGTCAYNDMTDRGDGKGACGGGASTTGNIYGVYDMSGGVGEYVMGYLTTANNNYASNPNTYFGWTDTENKAGFTSKPANKYFDAYTTSTVTTACSGSICKGHALSETAGWYSDDSKPMVPDEPWVARGGGYSGSTGIGIFRLSKDFGGVKTGHAFRSTLIKTGA